MIVGELLFDEQILSIKIVRELLAVCMTNMIYVYTLENLRLKDILNVYSNPKGLCSLNTTYKRILLACPTMNKGQILLKYYTETTRREIDAFDTSLACLELNHDGSILACASDRGTLIKLFNTETKELINEFRRGIDKAEIYSIAFHPTNFWIACSSDKGTIHIYSIGNHAQNPRSNLAFMKKVLPKYFESEWSYAQFRIKGIKTICCFAKDNSTIVAVTSEGGYYSIDYSEPGECKKLHDDIQL